MRRRRGKRRRKEERPLHDNGLPGRAALLDQMKVTHDASKFRCNLRQPGLARSARPVACCVQSTPGPKLTPWRTCALGVCCLVPRQDFPDGRLSVRVERRDAGNGQESFAVGIRGKTRSFLWTTSNSSAAVAAWGKPPCALAVVRMYNSLLEEAAALDTPACEICWGQLFATVQQAYAVDQ